MTWQIQMVPAKPALPAGQLGGGAPGRISQCAVLPW
jgi:hypothetical protein